jgi:hypothetical protein
VIALSAQATSFVNPNPTQQTTIEPVMNWKELIAEVTAVGSGGGADGPVTGVEYDSRKVRPGAVFVAMKGGSTDGNRYVEKAIAAGALAVITDSPQKFDHLLVFEAGLPRLQPRFSAIRSASSPPRASPAPMARRPLLF